MCIEAGGKKIRNLGTRKESFTVCMNKLRDVMLALRARLSMEFQMLLSNFFLAQIFLQLALLFTSARS